MKRKSKNTNQKVLVELRDGRKIEVNRYEFIKTHYEIEPWITKVSPFNNLLQHRFVPRKEIALEYNIEIPELPPDAHQNWPKLFWLFVDLKKIETKKSEGRILDIYYVNWHRGYDYDDGYIVKKIKDGDIKSYIDERLGIAGGLQYYKSEIFISDNYDTALPITTNYTRCPFCGGSNCIIDEHTLIPTFMEEKIARYEKNYALEYNFCQFTDKSFISVLQKKNLRSKEGIICRFCGSHRWELIGMKRVKIDKYFKIFKINDNIYNKKILAHEEELALRQGVPEDRILHSTFLDDINVYDDLYECVQCLSVFDKNGTVLLRPIDPLAIW